MNIPKLNLAAVATVCIALAGCGMDPEAPRAVGDVAPSSDSTSTSTTTGSTSPTPGTTTAPTGGAGSGASIPTLVSVNLQNVLNDLSVQLNVNRNNIPVTAQVPVEVAANVCGVSVSALAASLASGQATCSATQSSPQLTQAVQQQIASGGSVTGGDQTMGTSPSPR